MKKTNKAHIRMRFALIIGMMLLLSGAVLYRLHKSTIRTAAVWNLKADSVYTPKTDLPPDRGKILTDSGTVLAATLTFYTARVDWATVLPKKGKEVNDTLLKYLPALADSLHAFDVEKNGEKAKTAKQWSDELLAQAKSHDNRSYRLFRGLSHSEYKRLKSFPFFEKGRSSGLYSEAIPKRVKPYGLMASRSIGMVGKDLKAGMHGVSGLESALDSLLYGVPGVKQRVQLTNSVVDWESTPAVPGYDITTTINVQLQDIVENELLNMVKEKQAKWGTCILMEVATGEIKAISNIEYHDSLQMYIEGANNAVRGLEPGSIIKPISMMVALEVGVVNDINQKFSTQAIQFGERTLKDEHGRSGSLTPKQIIETSSNPGISRIILSCFPNNNDGFRQKLEEMGFFEPLNTGISGEETPKIRKLGNKIWERSDLANMSFGYTTRIPPMYILAMYNAIANNGQFIRPHLVKKLSRAGVPDSIIPHSAFVGKRVCSVENAEKLRIMLHEVVWGSAGTARKWVKDNDVEIAGKTGTANIVNPKTRTYDKGRNRMAFCGFFPYKNPKYTCIVVMLEPRAQAAESSGVTLKNIAHKMWALGLLDSERRVDYIKKRSENVEVPTLYATMNNAGEKRMAEEYGIGPKRVFSTPKPRPKGTVPDVRGLGLREAVRRLEDEGINVTFTGEGCVVEQSITAGEAVRKGDRIRLTLRKI